jgi:hypothetical protein
MLIIADACTLTSRESPGSALSLQIVCLLRKLSLSLGYALTTSGLKHCAVCSFSGRVFHQPQISICGGGGDLARVPPDTEVSGGKKTSSLKGL